MVWAWILIPILILLALLGAVGGLAAGLAIPGIVITIAVLWFAWKYGTRRRV